MANPNKEGRMIGRMSYDKVYIGLPLSSRKKEKLTLSIDAVQEFLVCAVEEENARQVSRQLTRFIAVLFIDWGV